MKSHSALLPLLTLACSRTEAPESRVQNTEARCAGEVVTFSLQAKETLPPTLALSFGSGPARSLKVQPPNSDNFVYLQTCTTNFTQFSLLGVVFMEKGEFGRFTFAGGDVVEGLDAAVFGDPAALRLELHHPDMPAGEMFPYEHFVMRGFTHGGASFVAAGVADPDGDGFRPLLGRVIAGDLVQGDMPDANGCLPGERHETSAFRLADARFETAYCTHITTDRSLAYRLLSLSVTDSNPAMAAELRGKTISVPAEQLAEIYSWGHHNVNDDFHLELPHATYSASSGSPFPGMARSASFEISYTGGASVKGGPVRVSCAGILQCELDATP